VTWKPGLKNGDQPELSEPLVVLELLDEPLNDDTATPDCKAAWECPDVIGGWLDDEEQLAVGCFDRRRLQPHVVIEDASEEANRSGQHMPLDPNRATAAPSRGSLRRQRPVRSVMDRGS
jgi:hypothetical protein